MIRSLGIRKSVSPTPLKVFWPVTLPSAKYGTLSAAALTFNLTITDFGNPVVFIAIVLSMRGFLHLLNRLALNPKEQKGL